MTEINHDFAVVGEVMDDLARIGSGLVAGAVGALVLVSRVPDALQGRSDLLPTIELSGALVALGGYGLVVGAIRLLDLHRAS
ncbi:MAG: hypothetical protein M1484_04905 [Patescibacteria group bacterium]|nr:hypothetical protein [Patescibacteria group bacterium]